VLDVPCVPSPKKHLKREDEQVAIASLRHPKDKQSDVAFLLNALGKLWLSGVEVIGQGFYAHERRHRLPLPTYPFERQRYWIEPQKRKCDRLWRWRYCTNRFNSRFTDQKTRYC
jgi:acyl transferase domain-containing protein